MLTEALLYRDDYVRELGAAALADEVPEGVAILRRALAHPDPRVRESATHGLDRVEWTGVDDQARATVSARLAEALEDVDPHVRSGAATALGRCGGAGAIEALKAALADPVEEVRLAVAAAIGKLDPKLIEQWTVRPSKPKRSPRAQGASPRREASTAESVQTPSEPAAEDTDPLAWLTPGTSSPPKAARAAKSGAGRIQMVECARCRKLCQPQWIRCHRCGARLLD